MALARQLQIHLPKRSSWWKTHWSVRLRQCYSSDGCYRFHFAVYGSKLCIARRDCHKDSGHWSYAHIHLPEKRSIIIYCEHIYSLPMIHCIDINPPPSIPGNMVGRQTTQKRPCLLEGCKVMCAGLLKNLLKLTRCHNNSHKSYKPTCTMFCTAGGIECNGPFMKMNMVEKDPDNGAAEDVLLVKYSIKLTIKLSFVSIEIGRKW